LNKFYKNKTVNSIGGFFIFTKMKIRIKDNSIRFRLTKSEVKKLCTEGYLQSTTELNTATLTYAIQVQENMQSLNADFVNNKITLLFPSAEAAVWNDSDRITYENTVILNSGNSLKLLLEKDFICLDHTHEDQSDNYENPNKTC
jgi:hypothetical protein